MKKFVFVVLCALLVGGALGDAALGNYYKDVVREQHKVINEMNQNFTELEKASEKLIDLGFYVGKHTLPPKTVKITKTVAVKVPVPFPVKVPEPVPVPVPVNKPVPVPVPTLVAVPVEGTAQTATGQTLVVTVPATSASTPTVATVPSADAAPASSLVHASTVQVQEYVQSFPIHSVYDAGDDYNPMEGNRLALAEHTASPTETTFSKQSPSSLQQLEEYQQRQHQHYQQQQQNQYHRQKSAQAGSPASAEQYHASGAAAATAPGQYYGGAQVQATPHPAAKFGPESHAFQPTAKPYGGVGPGYKLHTPAFARAPDTAYSAAPVYAGGKPAPSAPSAIGEDYHRFAGEQLHQRGGGGGGGAAAEGAGSAGQFGSTGGAAAGSSFGRGGSGAGIAGTGAGFGAAIGGGGRGGGSAGGEGASGSGAQSYVKFSQAAESQATYEESYVPRFQDETETLQAEQAVTTGREKEAEEGVRFGYRQGAGAGAGKGKEVNELTPRPFQTVRESYPRYEKPDFARYQAHHSEPENQQQEQHHHHHHHHHHDHGSAGGVRGGSAGASAEGAGGGLLTEGFDHPAFKPLPESTGAGGAGRASAEAHRYPVPGGRTYYQKVSTAGYHHSHPHHQEPSGEAHQNLRYQADAPVERFPFYQATKDDPHFARGSVQSHRAEAAAGGSAFQRYGGSKESSEGGGSITHHHHHHQQAGGYHTFTEHHPIAPPAQHEQFGAKHTGSYGATAKPTLFGVPSDAHLFPNYTPSGASGHHHHDAAHGGNHHHHHHHQVLAGSGHSHHQHSDTPSGKFHYHFHNVHVIGGDASATDDHHQSAASEHQYAVHGGGGSDQHDGGLVTSYDPPASGNTYHFHDDPDDLLAGASDAQEQLHQPPFGATSSYGPAGFQARTGQQ